MRKQKILFLCTGNSCRSQMAQGWTNHLRGADWEAYSAGIEPKELDHSAVEVMLEKGVDISKNRSKHINEYKGIEFDYIMTVCDKAKENCPTYTGSEPNLHFGFDDPSVHTHNASKEEKLEVYRRVRDLMCDVIEDILDNLTDHN